MRWVPLPWWTSQSTTAAPRDAVSVARVVDRHSHIREDAEAAAEIRLGVMAGRAHQGIAIVDRARDHRVHHRDGAARGEAGDLVAAVPERSPLPRLAAALGRERDDLVDVLGGVDSKKLLPGRRPGPDGGEIVKDSRHFHEIPKAPLAFGALGVLGRLYPETRRIPQRRTAGVVPHVELVEEKAGLVVHRGLPSSLRLALLPGFVGGKRGAGLGIHGASTARMKVGAETAAMIRLPRRPRKRHGEFGHPCRPELVSGDRESAASTPSPE